LANQTNLCGKCYRNKLEYQRKKRKQYIKENIITELTRAGVPPKYLQCNFDNFKKTGQRNAIYNKVLSYTQANKGELKESVFFVGDNGTGKTHLAVAVVREFILNLHRCYFITVPELLFRIRSRIRQNVEGGEEGIIKKFKGYGFLVLDELGAEKVTDYSLQILYIIIAGRENDMKPTLITSNLSLQGIENKLDPRLASRIGGGQVIKFNCEDHRLKSNGRG